MMIENMLTGKLRFYSKIVQSNFEKFIKSPNYLLEI